MAKLGIFASVAAIVASLTLAGWSSRPASADDDKCKRTEFKTEQLADKAAKLFGRHGWAETARQFSVAPAWRVAPLAAFFSLFGEPPGTLTIAYEYRPTEVAAPVVEPQAPS